MSYSSQIQPGSSWALGGCAKADHQSAQRRGSERGASAVEYALLVGLIAVAIIVSVSALGNRARTSLSIAANTLPGDSTPSWVWCGSENGTCTVPGTKTVRYGYAPLNQWAVQTKTGSFGCSNGVFGDPAYGYGKSCYYDANS